MIANRSRCSKILIDADAFPFKNEVSTLACKFNMDILFVTSVSHFSHKAQEKFLIVDNLPQAADMAIINNLEAGDIVVTQDFGLAALVLGKGGFAISPRGMIYDNDKIDGLMFHRHMEAKIRRGGGKTKGPTKMKSVDCEKFLFNMQRLIVKALDGTSSP